MKQLDLFENITRGLKSEIPSFEDWYAENSHERRTFGEKAYSKSKAISVYADLVESGFFHRGK